MNYLAFIPNPADKVCRACGVGLPVGIILFCIADFKLVPKKDQQDLRRMRIRGHNTNDKIAKCIRIIALKKMPVAEESP